MTYKIPYEGNLDWLVDSTILFTLFGSRAYGTSRPESDWDYRGVCIPPDEYRDGFLFNFAQADLPGEEDGTIYDIRKFMSLAADCNPSIMEVLFVEDEHVLHCTPQGQILRSIRQDFLSRKALHTFRGYAMQQLRRIETHRKWLIDPPTRPPYRTEFGLPEEMSMIMSNEQVRAALSMVRKKTDSWEIDYGDLDSAEKIHIQEQMYRFMLEMLVGADPEAFGAGKLLSDTKFKSACVMLGFDTNFIDTIFRERNYRNALKGWQQFQEWKKNRNEKRAALEALHGYDTKHGMHLVRLLRMCREILAEGKVLVMRPDADELNAIRDGAWSYEKLMEWAKVEDLALIEVGRTSPLPKLPNRAYLDGVCRGLVANARD